MPEVIGEPIVRFDKVDIVFGDAPKKALPLMDEGMTREEVKDATGQVLGVSNCSLEVDEGEILVLMGLSGSGKSTLLRAVNGLNPVIRGECLVRQNGAWVNPESCSAAQLRSLRGQHVSMVFQQFALLPWRTVAENVGLGLELAGVAPTERAEKTRTQLELVGLADWADRKVGELSGGMQQRVGLARAFATEAPILLMDEPFSALLPWRTVAENVGLGLELAGVNPAERSEKTRTQLELVGLADWADRKVGELSGGMQQRVGLARAFATEAPILLMDEPFSALDPLIRTRLQDELLDFQERLKRTIIFVSHDLDEAVKLGRRIAIMEGGRIIQTGTPQEIILHPADDYVSDFVAHMNPMGVLRAAEVMEPGTVPAGAAQAEPGTPLKQIMRMRLETGLPVGVGDGHIVNDDAIIRALLGR